MHDQLSSRQGRLRRIIAGAIRGTVAGAMALGLAAMAAGAGPATAALAMSRAAGSQVPIGGPQLAGHGVIINYPRHGHYRRLPSVPASAYVIADAGTGQVLAAKDPHGWYRPASTLKVLTAITLMPVLRPDAMVVASHRAAIVTPSKVGLVQGRSYKVSALFRALLMISANDAAITLAQATGSFSKGIAMMNAEARHLQADDTVAKQPNGLDARGQHVSAYDEALFARQALKLPAFMADEALRTTKFTVWPHHTVRLYTQNMMFGTFPGDLGGKIGWTTAAGATFIGWARRGHTTLVVTILHCTPLTEMDVAAKLLSWGFAMDSRVTPVGTLVQPLPAGGHHDASARHGSSARAARVLGRQEASGGVPMLPAAAGAAVVTLAGLASLAAMAAFRRERRAGSRHGP